MHKTRIEPVYLDTILYHRRKGASKSVQDEVHKEQQFSIQVIFSSKNIKTHLYCSLSVLILLFFLDVVYDTSSYVGILGSLESDLDQTDPRETYVKCIERFDFTWTNSNEISNRNYETAKEIARLDDSDGNVRNSPENSTIQRDLAPLLSADTRLRNLMFAMIHRKDLQDVAFRSLRCNNSNELETSLLLSCALFQYHITIGYSKTNLSSSIPSVCQELHKNLTNQQKIKRINIFVLILIWFAIATLSSYLSLQFHNEIIKGFKIIQDICDKLYVKCTEMNQEKKKSENLLYQMLPHSVADKLIAGQQVEAETFEEVTIYFSDIVGFNDVALSATPIQIVNLLNSIYGYVLFYLLQDFLDILPLPSQS